MGEFFFVLKTLIFSVVILFVLQLRLGGETLERKSERLIYHSSISIDMQSVAGGAIKAGHEGWRWAKVQLGLIASEKKRAPAFRHSSNEYDESSEDRD